MLPISDALVFHYPRVSTSSVPQRKQSFQLSCYGESSERVVAPMVTFQNPELNDFVEVMASRLAIFRQGKTADFSSTTLVDADSLTPDRLIDLDKTSAIFLMYEGEPISPELENVRQRCKYDIWVPKDRSRWQACINGIISLKQRLDSPVPTPIDTLLDAGLWSHFVSLTFPTIEAAIPKLPEIRIGADALELRVDLLEDSSPRSVHAQVALLREHCPLPIVFTVRTDGQIGKFPSDPVRIFSLLREGLRAGAEWVDVEACWPREITDEFCTLAESQYAHTSRLLGSLHVTTPQTQEQLREMYGSCRLRGYATMTKVVAGAEDEQDCYKVHLEGQMHERRTGIPYIGLCLGLAGQLSRVLNRRFTPVSHPAMAAAAPGQMSAAELMARRLEMGMEGATPLNMFLFGSPIAQSLSPAMHNAAFRALLLPHNYSLCEKAPGSCEEYATLMSESSFGGASVTIPHKEAIIPLLDEVREAAQDIGAVNTVVVETEVAMNGAEDRRLVGMNTDWLGIRRPVLRQLTSRGLPFEGQVGLVIGAGGTAMAACYAVRDLGLDLVVYNRSPEKAQVLAERFGGRAVASLEALVEELAGNDKSVHLVVSTVPAAAALVLPPQLLKEKPVVLDVVYRPARTALLTQALESGCLVVQGARMLHEQAQEQFQLWTGRRAPAKEMEAALFADLEKL
eukprot:gene8487-17494_t